jgi:hypothetical protein
MSSLFLASFSGQKKNKAENEQKIVLFQTILDGRQYTKIILITVVP